MSNFDEKAVDRIKKLEREVERLRVKESPDMSSYLGITAKAADSDKLDGIDSTGFSLASHDHDDDYLGITAKAADSDKLDGLNSTDFGRPVFLVTPLTSTSWDGDSFSATAKTLIDLSTVFGAPAGVKAIDVSISIRDSGSAAGTTSPYIILSPNNVSYSGRYLYCAGLPNDAWTRTETIVPCDANGDIYYQIIASGTGTMDVHIQIWGYWL